MAADASEALAEHVRRVPATQLRGLVSGCRGYRYVVGSPGTHRGLPSLAMTVVFAFGQPLDVGWLGERQTRGTFWGLASGLHTKAAEIFQTGRQFGIQLDLTAAGARRILGHPMAALARQLVAIDSTLPAWSPAWHDEVASQSSWRDRFTMVEDLLLTMAAAHSGHEYIVRPELDWAWSRLEQTGGREPVSALAGELGWSRRHLQRQFSHEYGILPKQAARIVRFQRSRSLYAARQPELGLSEIAVRCGYADQAHLTREWNALTGYPPRRWLQSEVRFVQDLAPAHVSGSGHD